MKKFNLTGMGDVVRIPIPLFVNKFFMPNMIIK
jgi:hypothetical protein